MFKNGKCVIRRCHKFYGKGLPLTLDILQQTFRLMLKPSSVTFPQSLELYFGPEHWEQSHHTATSLQRHCVSMNYMVMCKLHVTLL